MITEKGFSAIDVKATGDDGQFEGLAAVFGNIDGGRDIIAKGAFRATLREAKRIKRMPRFLLHHNPQKVAGVFDEMTEVERGLFVRGRFNLEKQESREAFSDFKMGASDGLSIGFFPRKTMRDESTGVRTIKELDLLEVSHVTFPMNEDARMSAVKSIAAQIMSKRDLEEHLRDVGFSANAAKGIAATGFAELRDGAADPALRALGALAESMKT